MSSVDLERAPGTLRILDDDIIRQVFEELQPRRHLFPISQTCKWVRALSKDVLFSKCIVKSKNLPYGRSHFVPEALWPYVRCVRISC